MSTLSFTAVANAQVRGDQPTTVLANTGVDLRVDDGAPKNAYLRFDVTGIPTGATVNGATLTLVGTADVFDSSAVRLHSVADTTWSESTITYNNAPTINSTVLDTETLGTSVTVNYTVPSSALPSGNGLVSFGLTRTASGTDTRICSRTHGTTGNRPSLVVDYTVASNVAPTVNAGTDQTITLPGVATLDATVSDPDSVETVLWTKVSGPGTVGFGNNTAVDTTASFDQAGTYVLRLTASDGVNTPVTDDITVTVNAGAYGINTFAYTGTWTTAGPANAAPEKYTKVVNSEAIIQATVGTGGGTVSLTAFKGTAKGIAGIKIDGGTETTITQYATARANATFWTSGTLTAGTHTIVVRCTGTKDSASTDTILSITGASITNGTLQLPSTPPANLPPTVSIASVSTVTLPGTATLNGTVTDPESQPVTGSWSQISGPGLVIFADPASIDTTASFDTPGTYILRLTGTDGVNSDTADVTVTVEAAPDTRLADAITHTQAALTAEQATPPGLGVAQEELGAALSLVNSLVGEPPANTAPDVSAGIDQTIVISGAVTLDGTVSDVDTDPVTVTWSKVSGPGTVSFGDEHAVDTTATFSATGTYVLRLTGTDGTATTTDDTTITVNAVPSSPVTVSAGPDQTATMSGAPTPTGPTGSWTLMFEDTFSGSSLDTTKWGGSGGWWTEGDVQNNVPTYDRNLSFANGELTLKLANESGTITGAGIDTGGTSRYKLPVGGVAEARVYFPGGTGPAPVYNWPAWWTSGPSNPAAGEHDIAEGFDGTLSVNYHSPSGSHNQGSPAGTWHNAYHIYTLHMKSTSADVYWDGQLVKTYSTDDNGGAHALILNVGTRTGVAPVTGDAGAMKVDYVRAWEPGTAAPSLASATLDGTVTGSGTLTGSWAKVSGPGTVAFANQNAIDTTATFSAAGVYVLRLTGTNGTDTVTDDMQVSVAAAAVNNPPTVSAGSDTAVTSPNAATLNGTATDPEGQTLTVRWSKVSGPGDVAFADPNVKSTTATFTAIGTYVLRLTANDGFNAAVTDDVTVTVSAAPSPPSGTTFGIGASASYIASLPMSGAAWTNLLSQANAPADLIYLNDASTGWPGGAVAAALAYVRAPSTYGNLRTKVLNFLQKAQNTNPADWWHAAANRNIGQLALAGELVGKDDTAWINWLKAQLTTVHGGPGRSSVMITCAWDWPNNHGAAALMSVAGLYSVLGTQTETLAGNPAGLVPAMKWLKGFCGDHTSTGFPSIRSTSPSYSQGMGVGDIPESDTWQLSPNDPYGIVPSQTNPTKKNGSIPADVTRDGATYPNAGANGLDHYIAGNLTRRVGAAIFLSKALNDTSIWTTGNSALKRARDWMVTYNGTMTSPHSWADPALNVVYGTSYPATNIGNEQWLGGTQWLASGGGWPYH